MAIRVDSRIASLFMDGYCLDMNYSFGNANGSLKLNSNHNIDRLIASKEISMETTNHDNTFDAINEILPEVRNQLSKIEQQIREQLSPLLSQQMQKQLAEYIIEIEKQGEQEYRSALNNLNQQREKLTIQKLGFMSLQLQQIVLENSEKEQIQLSNLQDRYLVANFNQKVLKHPRIQKLEIQLEQDIFESEQLAGKYEANRNRKVKEISIQLEQKEAKYRRDRDKAIRNRHNAQSGIEQLQNDIQLLRVAIASMKSEYNVRIRKIDNDIKNDKKKCKEFENKEDLSALRDLLSQLERVKLQKQQESEIQPCEESQESNMMLFNFNSNVSGTEISTQPNGNSHNFATFDKRDQQWQRAASQPNSLVQHTNFDEQAVYINEDVIIESSSENDSSKLSAEFQRDEMHPLQRNARASHQQKFSMLNPPETLLGKHRFVTEDSCQIANQEKLLKGPILGIDIHSLLRERWEERENQDPLGKYLTRDSQQSATSNENDARVQNCDRSEFYEQYHSHLKRLSGGYNQKSNQIVGKRRKLSAFAKQTIIRNIASEGFKYH